MGAVRETRLGCQMVLLTLHEVFDIGDLVSLLVLLSNVDHIGD